MPNQTQQPQPPLVGTGKVKIIEPWYRKPFGTLLAIVLLVVAVLVAGIIFMPRVTNAEGTQNTTDGITYVVTPTPGTIEVQTCLPDTIVGTTVKGATDAMPTGINLFGNHWNGLFLTGEFSSETTVTLHPEDIVIVVFDRDDPNQNPLPAGFNNISGREGKGDAVNLNIKLGGLVDSINSASGSKPVTVEQVKLVIILPIVNCQTGINWDWADAVHQAWKAAFTPKEATKKVDTVIEGFMNGNWDGKGVFNPTQVWALF